MTQRDNKWVYLYENIYCFEKKLKIKGHKDPEPSVDGLPPTRDLGDPDMPMRVWEGHRWCRMVGGAPIDTLLFKLYGIIQFIIAISKNIPFT